MTIYQTDNSINLLRHVIWQYDKSPNLIAIISMLQAFHDVSVKSLYDFFSKILQIGNNNNNNNRYTFSIDFVGILIGVYRPSYQEGNEIKKISDDLFIRIIKARILSMCSNMSMKSINDIINIVFNGRVSVMDNLDMTITYNYDGNSLSTEEKYLIESYDRNIYELVTPFPAGVGRKEKELDNDILGLNDTETIGQNKFNFSLNEGGTGGTFAR